MKARLSSHFRALAKQTRRATTKAALPWEKHISLVQDRLDSYCANVNSLEPRGLFDPCSYILNLPAKRIRPALVLLSYELFHDDFPKKSMDAALSVELFHNATLVHDDIMDESPLRRGHQTVHMKWNVNSAILSGNVLLIESFRAFEDLSPQAMQRCLRMFSNMSIEVHQGQQMDVDFETMDHVTIPEYIEMIRLKTSVLLAAALKLGAIVADAPEKDAQNLYDFGVNLGIAFQIQDDYLDLWGEQAKVGKRLGGDIYDNKKTILYLKALERADSSQREELLRQYEIREEDPEKLATVKSIFEELEIDKFVKDEMANYKAIALESLTAVNTTRSKESLEILADYLIKRTH